MKELRYQRDAVQELTNKTIRLLNLESRRKKLIFEAPTGSGKTVMAAQMLNNLVEELQSRGDSHFQKVAFIWIAPNKLHEQSYFKMKAAFSETRVLRPVMYDELDHSDGYIHEGEILFVNWESINKDNALIIRDSEQSKSLFEITRRTQEEQGLPIVVVIDEEHLFWSKTADKSAKVLQQINPYVEVRISATPKTINPDEIVRVYRQDVIEEQMIKEEVILNPNIEQGYTGERELNDHLIKTALAKRQQLAEAYQKLGVNINPLLLIQLPNDTSATMTADDETIAEQVKLSLSIQHGITEENGKLAVWLSNEKSNLAGLEKQDNLTEVLLFKQAIALGWDCPRAAVLLIFRKMNSDQFTIQTVGRILRMPEQHFYTDPILNRGYVYTDIAKDKIQIVAEDMDYLHAHILLAKRRDSLKNVELKSTYIERTSAERNRLGSDFKEHLMRIINEEWLNNQPRSLFYFDGDGNAILPAEDEEYNILDYYNANRRKATESQRISFDVKNIKIEIPKDVHFQNEIAIIETEQKASFARSAGEIDRIYLAFCSSLLGQFEKAHSTKVLARYLTEILEQLFALPDWEAKKVVLYYANKPKFEALIKKSLSGYARILSVRQKQIKETKGYKSYTWEVPEDRIYDESTHHVVDTQAHALLPFVELNNVFAPEVEFAKFLESQKEYIDWWYKNGDSGKQNYAVPYTDIDGDKSLFYVDFVIRLKNGKVFLFDTKTEGSDDNAPNKHNALLDYMNDEENSDKNLKGGIIIRDGGVWKYSPLKIDNTTDTTNWSSFFPDVENN